MAKEKKDDFIADTALHMKELANSVNAKKFKVQLTLGKVREAALRGEYQTEIRSEFVNCLEAKRFVELLKSYGFGVTESTSDSQTYDIGISWR